VSKNLDFETYHRFSKDLKRRFESELNLLSKVVHPSFVIFERSLKKSTLRFKVFRKT
jgi:hypothetical protein